MNLSHPVHVFRTLSVGVPCSPLPALAFESQTFQLGNALVFQAPTGSTHIILYRRCAGTLKLTSVLRPRGFGWKYCRLGAPLALSFLLFRSDLDAVNLGFLVYAATIILNRICKSRSP